MKRYDSYKDTDIPWVGNIPNHWVLSLVGRHFEIGRGRVISKVEIQDNKGDYPVYSSQTSNNGELGRINTYDFDGDYVTWTTDGVHTGTCFYRTGKFNTTNVCGMLSLRRTHYSLPFLSYYLNMVTKPYVRVDINPKLMNNMMSEIPLIIPPLSEQQQIVSFLDTKTSLIDSLIEKTQRKIELLKEKRTSLINEVVTKGLNPNVEMKDSGVEWIGEIPKGWRIGKLYQYSEMSNGSTPSRVKPEYWENGSIPWMSSGEINKKKIRDIDGRITQEGFENSSTKILPIGTVMMGLNGQGKTKGTVGILEIETTCNQSLCGMIFKDDMYPMFSYYFLDSQYYHIRGLVGEGQREGISVSFLGRYPLVVPPISEQQQIVEYLDEQTGLIDKTISIEEKRIELLKEYRQSLISEVVTGKRKVV